MVADGEMWKMEIVSSAFDVCIELNLSWKTCRDMFLGRSHKVTQYSKFTN